MQAGNNRDNPIYVDVDSVDVDSVAEAFGDAVNPIDVDSLAEVAEDSSGLDAASIARQGPWKHKGIPWKYKRFDTGSFSQAAHAAHGYHVLYLARGRDPPVLPLDSQAETHMQPHTNTSYLVEIPGDPKPKPSPRFHAFLKWPKGCLKKGTPTIQKWIQNLAEPDMKQFSLAAQTQLMQQALNSRLPVLPNQPVWVKIFFFKRPPNNMFIGGSNRTRPKEELSTAINNGTPVFRAMKPDTDNCVKFVLDALSKVAWKDDYQVCFIQALKCYDTRAPYEGRTEVYFGPM